MSVPMEQTVDPVVRERTLGTRVHQQIERAETCYWRFVEGLWRDEHPNTTPQEYAEAYTLWALGWIWRARQIEPHVREITKDARCPRRLFIARDGRIEKIAQAEVRRLPGGSAIVNHARAWMQEPGVMWAVIDVGAGLLWAPVRNPVW